jgi:hypothetical protein
MKKLTISSSLGKILFYLFNIIWYVPLLLSVVSLALHLPIYFHRYTNPYADVYYLQESVVVASSGGSSIDFPNIYFFLASILIILVFVLGNLFMTYKRAYVKWYLISILALYAIFTIGLYSLELISF